MKVIPEVAAQPHTLAFVLWALACTASPCLAQSKPNQAGEISAMVPVGYVLRGTAPAVPAQRSDPLYWQDTVRTESGGRIRIGLLDGSILNVGSQSSLTITKHDPATQQTQLELLYGRIRAKVVRIMQPGGSFKVRTPVAVAGVVGTRLDVATTNDTTVVLDLEDTVRVRNAEDRVAGEVILHPGEFTRVQRGMPPTAPSPASPEQLRESEDATSVSDLPGDWSRVEVSLPPPGCGQEFTLFVRAWSKQTQNGKEIETPVDPELVAGKLLLGSMTVAVKGGSASLTNAPGSGAPVGTFVPEGKQAAIPAKIWSPMKMAEGQGWRAPRATFVGNSFYVLGPIGSARQVAFTFGGQPATVLWIGPCGAGLLAPMIPGGTYPVSLSIGGQVVANGKMNLVQVSYDLPIPPALLRGQTTKFGIELRGLAGLDQFVQGRPIEVTTVINNTPTILGGLRSQTPGASAKGETITYRVGAGNVDASGLARLDATGRGRQRGEFVLGVENKLDEALELPSNPLTRVPPRP
ncbi:MAG TPA: FecR domain-containing protein [Terriglobales bacterium]|nr:FecR domain-containing protein [Terriglobales bacterium]